MNYVGNWGITHKVSHHDLVWKATICHDLLEDTDANPAEVRALIGDAAYGVMEELAFRPNDDSQHDVQKDLYLRSFAHKSIPALVIKLAD